MRISDWSSDVCSSDLHDLPPEFRHDPVAICQVGCRDGLVNRRPFRAYWGLIAAFGMLTGCHAAPPTYDIIIRPGTISDGTGGAGMIGDVALRAGRIAFVGAHARGAARQAINARGTAVSPGFINMLSWSTEGLLIDGRAQSDLRQGVTLEVMGEGESMGPL